MTSSISVIMCCLKMDFLIKGFLFASLLWTSVDSAPRQKRLSLASQSPSYYYTDIDGLPGTYSFGYDVFDIETGNTQFRSEEKYPNGTVVGSYGYIDPRGRSRRYDYIADESGYRIMNDAAVKQNYQAITNENPTTEASITWTRPRKSNKKQQQKRNERPPNFLKPPSFYTNL